MKINALIKQLLPHLAILAIFIAFAFIYFFPVMQGKVIHQMDGSHATGMAKEVVDYKEKTGDVSMWTNSAFAGMPAYQIKGDASNNVFWYVNRIIHLGLPYSTVAIMFIYLLGFYILLISLKVNRWLSLIGAIAFALASYNIIIIDAGHITKAYAIGLMAPVIGGLILTFEKKYISGGLISLVALGLQIAVNHVQITYYLMLMAVLLGIHYFVISIKNKELPHFGKAVGILVLAALLAVGPNLTQLWTTYEYGKESIRGKSDLTPPEGKPQSDGLDKEYALDWSYGKVEMLTLLIPNAVGGESVPIGKNETALSNVDDTLDEVIANNFYQYWGSQPFTSGPVYMGAIIFLLFVLGFVVVKNPIKWWILATTILSLLLAMGKNLEWFTDLFFYYVPLYSKFRTVAMALVIAGVTIPLMAILALKEMIEHPQILKEKQKQVFATVGVVAAFILILYAMPRSFDFVTDEETQMLKYQQEEAQKDPQITDKQAIIEYFRNIEVNLENARIAVFRADAMRSFIFILLAGGVLFLLSKSIINKQTSVALLGVLIAVDMWSVDTRYLNYDDFEDKQYFSSEFAPSLADNTILKDTDLNYRVLNLTRSPFNDAYTSYFHKSIGGYHGAKLRRYQDVIDNQLVREIQLVQAAIKSQNEQDPTVFDILTRTNVLNMLNARYIIYDPQTMPLINMNTLGNAWFVNDYSIVANADAEIKALATFDPSKTAIVDKRFLEGAGKIELPKAEFFDLDTGYIQLTNYAPNRLVYKCKNPKKQLAVFSEIYYNKGWNAYIDGKPTTHIRVNYLLRALVVPQGQHSIEFKFEPKSYYLGNTFSMISSIIVLLLIVGGMVFGARNLKIKEVVQEVEEVENEKKPLIRKLKTKHKRV